MTPTTWAPWGIRGGEQSMTKVLVVLGALAVVAFAIVAVLRQQPSRTDAVIDQTNALSLIREIHAVQLQSRERTKKFLGSFNELREQGLTKKGTTIDGLPSKLRYSGYEFTISSVTAGSTYACTAVPITLGVSYPAAVLFSFAVSLIGEMVYIKPAVRAVGAGF